MARYNGQKSGGKSAASTRGGGKAGGASKSTFAQKPVRRSALISPWGVGAMVDFTGDETLMTAGLDAWPEALKECPADWLVQEERLQQRLGVEHFRLPPDFRQRSPGVDYPLQKIPAVRFPQWHYCARCGNLRRLSLFGGRERCDAPRWPNGLSCEATPERRRPFLLPAQFVAVCREKGHIQDFPFLEWAHQNKPATADCRLRLQYNRSKVSMGQYVLRCSCGESRSLEQIHWPGALDKVAVCCGQRPWLGEMNGGAASEAPQGCGSSLKVVQRGATNVYFAHTAASIYLPLWGENQRASVVETLEDSSAWEFLSDGLEDGKIALMRCTMFCQINKWRNLEPAELQEAAQRRLDAGNAVAATVVDAPPSNRYIEEERYRFEEYEAMRTGRTVEPELEMSRFSGADYGDPIRGFFRTVTLVRKLRETRVLYGFSRLVPDDGRSPDEHKSDLSLDPRIKWLPASVTRGEGIFFELDDTKVARWLENRGALERAQSLIRAMQNSQQKRGRIMRELSPKFVLLHTLAHLLINQLSYDCGYGASSLRERIYCDGALDNPMQGFLIYTA